MATKGKINVDFTMRYIGALRANRIVANPNRYSTINYKDIVTYAARAAHVPESSIEVAMDALYDALSYFVLNGHNVKIDGLGTFFFGINAFAEEQIENAGADAIYRLKIGYLPEKDLREAMNNVAVTTSYTNPGNLAVDPNVPAYIDSINSMLSQTAREMKEMSFGSVHQVPENGLYVRVTGVRLDRLTAFTGVLNLVADVEGETNVSLDNAAASISVVAQNAKNLILYIAYPSFDWPEEATNRKVYVDEMSLGGESGTVLHRYYSCPDRGSALEKLLVFAGTKSETGAIKTGDIIALKGGLVAIPNAPYYRMTILGANLTTRAVALNSLFDPTKMRVDEVTSLSDKRADFWFTPLAEQIPYGAPSRGVVPEGQMVFNISGGGQSNDPVVASLTANGISVSNGGSSTVQAGQSYNFVFAGANLGGLTQSNLVVPEGATISNFNASASQVRFTLTIGQAGGNIGINYNGASLFSVAVTIPTNISASVTTIGGVSNNGTLQVSPNGDSVTVNVAGTGLSSLSASNFVMSGKSMSLAEGTDTQRALTITGTNGFAGGDLRVQIDGTTIFTVTIDTGDSVEF